MARPWERWWMDTHPAGSQSPVGVPRVRAAVSPSCPFWMRGPSAPSNTLQMKPSWVEVLTCLRVWRLCRGIPTGKISVPRPMECDSISQVLPLNHNNPTEPYRLGAGKLPLPESQSCHGGQRAVAPVLCGNSVANQTRAVTFPQSQNWWGCTSNPVSSSGSLTTVRALRGRSVCREGNRGVWSLTRSNWESWGCSELRPGVPSG